MDQSDKPPKQETFLSLLKEGWVSLHLDARSEGVVVPAPFSSQPHLALQYGYNMPIPIEDLEVTPAGVSASLSFSRIPHRTYVPWSAVYLITSTNGTGVLYQEDVPADVALSLVGEREKTNPLPQPASPNPQRPTPSVMLHALPNESIEDTAAEGLAMLVHSRKRRRPQLRLIK
jgi:stringent starvation protein B